MATCERIRRLPSRPSAGPAQYFGYDLLEKLASTLEELRQSHIYEVVPRLFRQPPVVAARAGARSRLPRRGEVGLLLGERQAPGRQPGLCSLRHLAAAARSPVRGRDAAHRTTDLRGRSFDHRGIGPA